MKKLILLLSLLLSGTFGILAQDNTTEWEEPASSETNEEDLLYVPESWDVTLDSLINSWYVKFYVDKNSHPGYHEAVVAGDEVYVERLSKMNNIIELPYNDIVRRCIDLYVDRRRDRVEYMLGLENLYFPMIEQALDENDLPLELKYLVIIESALNPVAVSRVGATGLWQFMLGTGKQYDLEVNSLVDERRDPVKATYAACQYLKDMYRIYGDWTLVIASYNCGSGNVNKAIRRAGGSTDYWKIYPYLPKETRLYVPLFIAANYVMNYYANHQLRPVKTNLPIATDTVMITQPLHFDQVAEVLKIDKDLIRMLNPQYKRDIIPGNSKPRTLKLPAIQTYAFAGLEDSIFNYRKDEYFANRTYIADNNSSYNAGNNKEKIIHKVKKGENLRSIGSKYGVSATSIRKWNGLKSNSITAGKRLTIYVDNGGYATAQASDKTVSNAKPATNNKPVNNKISADKAVNDQPANEPATNTPSKSALLTASEIATYYANLKANPTTTQSDQEREYGQYKVKSGDSYYSIAKKYPGYSENDLMKINRASSPKLKIGQYIKVPKV
jgi:membrane-bound lytic murein transglycosylase D